MIHSASVNAYDQKAIEQHKVVEVLKGNRPSLIYPQLNTNSKILDLGGGHNCWGLPYVNHIADFLWSEEEKQALFEIKQDLKLFSVDIEDYRSWRKLENYCKKNGKFDFIICTHTLEDLNNPLLACQKMNEIGKAGYISVPTKYAELSKFENYYPKEEFRWAWRETGTLEKVRCGGYKGYHHHRWVFQLKDNTFIGYPKQNSLEVCDSEEVDSVITSKKHNLRSLGAPIGAMSEFAFWWKDSIDYEFVRPHALLDNLDKPPRMGDLLNPDDLTEQAFAKLRHD
tara:strand:+ start:893 stop:1741 length:849 start_codon:yes stop_codon:yes gene_type:complete